jgi:hypothetical protein
MRAIEAAERIGLNLIACKTKWMEVPDIETSLDVLETPPYEKVDKFQ